MTETQSHKEPPIQVVIVDIQISYWRILRIAWLAAFAFATIACVAWFVLAGIRSCGV